MYYRQTCLSGFRTQGLLAVSDSEVMGDPCQLLNRESVYDSFMHAIRGLPVGRWITVFFDGARIRVLITGADGSYYGTGTDTATIIRMKKKDWERLK